jgi:PAS domain S-box-containing protein
MSSDHLLQLPPDDQWPGIMNNPGIFQRLVHELSLVVFLLDRQGNLLYANPATAAALGCCMENFQEAAAQILEKEARPLLAAIQQVMEQERQSILSEYTLTRPDGFQRAFHITLRPFSYVQENDVVQAILGTAVDITEQKQAVDALNQRSQEIRLLHSAGQKISETLDLKVIYHTFYDLVASIMPHDSLFVSSFDPQEELIHCEFAIIEGNELDIKKLPPIPLEPEGMGTQSVVIRSGEPLLINDMQERLVKTKTVIYVDEKDNLYDQEEIPDEAPRTRSALIVPLILDGKTVGAIQAFSHQKGAYSDADLRIMQALASQIAVASNNALLYEKVQAELAERTKLQAELEEERNLLAQRVRERTADLIAANEELLQALRIKDEFLANMSHELRTPLNAILGMSESLGTGTYGAVNPRHERPLRIIQQSGEHLLQLISDILDLTKIQTGRIEPNPVQISLQEMVAECLAQVEESAAKKQIHLQCNLGENGWMVGADRHQLKQVLLNLLSNAIKFTESGGKVGIDLDGDLEPGRVAVIVWDTGIGIQPDDMQKLFQPFLQLDSGLSRKYEGTGLGLALSLRLVELNGGTIRAESEGIPGKGSRFIVSFPALLSSVEESAAGNEEAAKAISTNRILVAEDNPANLETLVSYLEQCGFDVVVAQDGWQAVDQARQQRPNLILMDIQLPLLDGLNAIRIIRKDLGMTDISIIALTALAMPGDREKCLAAGADIYLSKPVRLKALVETIEDELARLHA